MRKLLCCLILLTGIQMGAYAQKQTSHASQTWVAYFNQTRFNQQWGLWADLQLRTRDHLVQNLSAGLARLGLTYYIDDNTRLTLGYAFINHYPSSDAVQLSQPEHRPWQQLQWFTRNKRTRLMQYIRLEERFRQQYLNNQQLSGDWSFNYRLRYNITYQIPLHADGLVPKKLSMIVNDELHVNFGQQVVNNYFDQNRFFLGLNYSFDNDNNLQFGYLNTFIQLPAGNQYRNLNILRVAYLQNINLHR